MAAGVEEAVDPVGKRSSMVNCVTRSQERGPREPRSQVEIGDDWDKVKKHKAEGEAKSHFAIQISRLPRDRRSTSVVAGYRRGPYPSPRC
jgi:hypothetical protein